MRPSYLESELSELLSAICEGTADEELVRRVESLARNDIDVCRVYLRYVSLHGSLGNLFAEPAGVQAAMPFAAARNLPPHVVPASSLEAAPPGESHRRRFSARLLAIAASLLLVCYFVGMAAFVSMRGSIRSNETHNPEHQVATVLAAEDLRWSAESDTISANQPVRSGKPLSINSGFIQLQLAKGATLLVEGPAIWTIDGDNSATLKHGKLVAKVPPLAVGFALSTPTTRIVDLGTEFGVDVKKTGETNVLVYAGTVDAETNKAISGAAPSRIRLQTGEGLKVRDVGGEIKIHRQSVEPDRFVRSLKRDAEPATAQRSTARDQLLQDRTLLVHYLFDGPGKDAAVLANHAAATSGKNDGKIDGCRWIDGSTAGRSALEFGEPSDRVKLHVEGEFPALTIGASILFKPLDKLPHYSPILMGDSWGTPGQFHFQLHADARPNISICGENEVVYGINCSTALSKNDFGRWLKLVVILNTQSGEAVFFLDGALIGSTDMHRLDHLVLSNMHIGYWLPWKKEAARNLAGALDELIIFGRALQPSEVRLLWNPEVPHGK